MSNKRFIIQRFRFPIILTFDLSRGRGNKTSTNIVWYLYSFRALFVLYEAELDNKSEYTPIFEAAWSNTAGARRITYDTLAS